MFLKKTLFLAVAAVLLFLPSIGKSQIKLTWEVLKYDIGVTLPADMDTARDADISAALELKNQSAQSFDRISLRISDAAKISEITSGGSKMDFTSGEEKGTTTQKIQLVRVNVPRVSAGSAIKINVKYKLKVDANSGLATLSPLGSQFLPLSLWYPTPTSMFFPEGGDYAPFDISVQGAGREIVSAGSFENQRVSNPLNGMPFFVTGIWKRSDHNGVQVFAPDSKHVVPGRDVEIALFANEAKAYIENVLGKKIIVPLKIVSVQRGAGFSDSGVIFVEKGAFMSRSLDSKTAASISESIAKTVLGNVVQVRGVGFGAIREGMSRFISNRFLEQKYGKLEGEVIRLRQKSNYTAIADKDSPLSLASPVDGYFYSANGNKGAMIWNYLYQTLGEDFLSIIKSDAADGNVSLAEIRTAFNGQKVFLDYSFDQVTLMNLMIGNPVQEGGASKAALRNFGDIDVTVKVAGYDSSGKVYPVNVTIPANGLGEAAFSSGIKIVRVEVDPEKIHIQNSYFDDVAPRTIQDNDPIVFIKREFDRQAFDAAAKNAIFVLERYPELDEARVFLGRSYLALEKITDAKTEFDKVLKAKSPAPQSLAWSLFGLGEAARKTGQQPVALQFYNEAIWSDADYGASLLARRSRAAMGMTQEIPADVAAFFAGFDKAVIANSKREVDVFILKGEVARFSSSVAGQAQEWGTRILAVDEMDSENLLVEAGLTLKLLNREVETGSAVFRLSRVNGRLRLTNVEVFEVS